MPLKIRFRYSLTLLLLKTCSLEQNFNCEISHGYNMRNWLLTIIKTKQQKRREVPVVQWDLRVEQLPAGRNDRLWFVSRLGDKWIT